MIYKIAKFFQGYVFSIIYTFNRIALKLVGVRVGRNLRTLPITTIENPSGIVIGDNVWISKNVALYASSGIRIGNDVIIAKDVSLISGDHGHGDKNLKINQQAMKQFKLPITIEDDVWIGEKAIILKGVTVGGGSVIGAGSVVTKDVAPFSIVAGNPAKIIKKRG
jgi:acetyltransferase-like isoleucine patch superfamily enzyme